MTTAASLVARVRNIVGDYGDGSLALAAAVADTTGTTFTVDAVDNISVDDRVMLDYEMAEVTAKAEGPPSTITVRRGARGSTAAVHANGAVGRINPRIGDHDILAYLNAAQSKLSKVVSDETLAVIDDDYDYAIPATIGRLARVEIEDSNEAGQFAMVRSWDYLDHNNIRIYGRYIAARNIRFVGTTKFTSMVAGGDLDADFPDDNDAALAYLVYAAVAPTLLQVQATVAARDSFVGVTDAFANSLPEMSVRTSRYYLAEAEQYRRIAIGECAILRKPQEYLPNPTRAYDGRS